MRTLKNRCVKALAVLFTACLILGMVILPSNAATEGITLSGTCHVQDYGDTNGKWDAEAGTLTLGTRGQSKRVEAITVNLNNTTGISGSLRYRVHVQNIGWQDFKNAGTEAGTRGQSLRLEGMEIELTGDLATYYTVEYAVHIQDYGDAQGFVSDGALAGTTGESKRLEEVRIRIVPKGQGTSTSVNYRVHRQDYGWETKWAKDGEESGTTGQSKRLEGIEIHLTGNQYKGGITYHTHVQNIGWESNWSKDGEMSGTQGMSYRLEGIEIKLTGEVANHYDVYYRVHAQDFGWLGWAKNGEMSGTSGLSKRLEAIQIVLVAKGAAAPGNINGVTSTTDIAAVTAGMAILPGGSIFKVADGASVSYALRTSSGWSQVKSDGQVCEISGKCTGIAVGVRADNAKLDMYAGVPDFKGPASDGTAYDSKESIKIVSTGKFFETLALNLLPANGNYNQLNCRIFYRVKNARFGWMAWTSYGRDCGTDELGETITAIQIVVVPNNQSPAANLGGVTSNDAKYLETIADYPAKLITDGNPFAQWCLEQFPADTSSTETGFTDWHSGVPGEGVFRRYYMVSPRWPYRYGGSSRTGCDCSGFVVYVMREYFNKNVYHGMHTLSWNRGRNISYSEMRPGDWLCDWSYQHGWVCFYVGTDEYGHQIVLKGEADGNIVRPVLVYWDIEKWASEDKHDIRRP